MEPHETCTASADSMKTLESMLGFSEKFIRMGLNMSSEQVERSRLMSPTKMRLLSAEALFSGLAALNSEYNDQMRGTQFVSLPLRNCH